MSPSRPASPRIHRTTRIVSAVLPFAALAAASFDAAALFAIGKALQVLAGAP